MCKAQPLRCVQPNRRAFSLVEVLVVVAIISLLIAILLPVLGKVRGSAMTAECLSDKYQIATGLYSYAMDNDHMFPDRNGSQYGYPHQMRRIWNGKYDLNEPFIIPYIGDRAHLFCPALPTTTEDLNDNWATSQYHVFPTDLYWQVPRPDLSGVEVIKGRAPLWSCFARIKYGQYIAHGRHNVANEPEGMLTAYSDGSAEWVAWADTEIYWRYQADLHYWPIYRQ